MSEIVDAPQPEAGEPTLKLSRSHYASGWTLKAYDALWEAAQEGRALTRSELVDECVKRFNRSATMQWWREYILNRPECSESTPYRRVVEIKTNSVLKNMRSDELAANVGGRGPRSSENPPRYTIGPKRPRVWVHARHVPGHPADYDPETKHDAGRLHTARLAWRDDARRALEAKRPTGMKELVERAIDLFFEQ